MNHVSWRSAWVTPALTIGLALGCASAFAQTSGIDRSAADPAVRIQDDAYRAVNGHWLATTEIPADRSGAGSNYRIYDRTQLNLRAIIETAATPEGARVSADARKIGDLYASFMDEARVEARGLAPLRADLARIDAMKTASDVVAMFAALNRLGADAPLQLAIHQDAKDPSLYFADLNQSGIGLPDRDYFLKTDDERFATIRAKYRVFLAALLVRAGDRDADAEAGAIVALENALAEAQWDNVRNRDPDAIYNPTRISDLAALAPGIDWARYLKTLGVTGRTTIVGLAQPSFVTDLGRLVATTPLATWKAYCKTRLLVAYAPFLDRDLVATRFAFVGTTLVGAPENTPRWKRGTVLVETSMGEGLGKLYVAKHFPPENKARVEAMVGHILDAYRDRIAKVDWMGDETKAKALAKLAKFTAKIGYPKRWRDYGALVIRRDDLVGNVKRARVFAYDYELHKLGHPIDRDEWGITPQTVNAYYNPEMNEIVFAAGWLQAPFFDPAADEASNYGAIGGIMGHEISHGFDDQGAKYDGDGRLANWWTADDLKRFQAKTKALVAQYDQYVEIPGYPVNGALTLGENIADNAGLAVAFDGYHRSLGGKPAPVIDGLTGDERFYMGWAQGWQSKLREPAAIRYIKSDQHSPGQFRTNGTLVNQEGFYKTFGVKPGDKMYRAPEERVSIW